MQVRPRVDPLVERWILDRSIPSEDPELCGFLGYRFDQAHQLVEQLVYQSGGLWIPVCPFPAIGQNGVLRELLLPWWENMGQNLAIQSLCLNQFSF